MSTHFSGVTFANQKVTPSYDATIRRALMSDGILSGCKLSYSGSTLTMEAGQLMVCGRQIVHTAVDNWAVTGATSGFARLVLIVDLTGSSTKDVFDQVRTEIQYATAVAGFPALTTDDINGSGTIYQIPLCIVSLGSGGITGIVSKAAECVNSSGTKGIIPVADGGTGATTPKEAAKNLQVPTLCACEDIPSGSNLNNYVKIGNYACSSNATAKTLSNVPPNCTQAFKLEIFDAIGSGYEKIDTSKSQYVYLIQRLETINGAIWERTVTQSAKTVNYGNWANVFSGNAPVILSTNQYGTALPTAGTQGRLFFKKVSL